MPHATIPTFHVIFTEGDQLPELSGVLAGIDLTGQTIRLTLERPSPSTVLTKTAILTSPSQGKFKIEWDPTDLVFGLGQLAVLRLENAATQTQTLARFILDINELPA